MSPKSSSGLIRVFREKGSGSKEFFEYSRGFFEYVIKRYNNGVYDEEIHSLAYKRLLEATLLGRYDKEGNFVPPYFDCDKNNITSFIFTIVRNTVSGHCAKKSRYSDVFDTVSQTCADDSLDENWMEYSDSDESFSRAYSEFDFLSTISEVQEFVSISSLDNPLKKAFIWQSAQLNFLSIGR